MITAVRTTERVTVTLPAELRAAMDRARRGRRISASAFISEAVRRSLAAELELEQEERWVEGYRRYPLTGDESQLPRHGISGLVKRFDATPE